MHLVPPTGAPCRGDHAGTSVVAGDLTVAGDLAGGEISPVRAAVPVVSRGGTVPTPLGHLSVTVYLKMDFSILQN